MACTETQYMIVTHKEKITVALQAVRDCLPDDKYGISKSEYEDLVGKLYKIQSRLFYLINSQGIGCD